MKTDELREKYLSFFASKGCVRRPTDVLVPKDDPTVLFTPAGMNQFKNQFLGIGPLEFTAATTCQKCIRTGDISNVGVTAYHHTFFEMLGNFSFGDYFKREAIHWAWEFLTSKKWLGLEPERLTITVYLNDDEAAAIWQNEIGIPANRITREDEYENFWPAGSPTNGPDGVCGPCSEIYYTPPKSGKKVEIWNLVFTQFNRKGNPPNNLIPLPKKNIDTGMGLERTASVMQGHESNFEIDILKPLCMAAGDILGLKYAYEAPHGRALRRIVDHVRACTFAIHENCLPDNEKEGYIVRLLLRRAAMEGFLLGKQEPFLHQLVPAISDMMRVPYPELANTNDSVMNAIKEEERAFLSKVDAGLGKFKKLVDKAKAAGKTELPGDDVFDLHTTDGFLFELSESLAANEGLVVNKASFEALMEEHKKRSGSGAFADSVMSAGPLDTLRQAGPTQFLGYDNYQTSAKIVGIISNKELASAVTPAAGTVGVVLDQTPFYAEAGGQVGDLGELLAPGTTFVIEDSQKDGDLIVHIGKLTSGSLSVGQQVTAQVSGERRDALRRAHSATHILHYALRTTLGPNATQRGSKVEPDQLRFDFAHPQSLTQDEFTTIERIINQQIAAAAPIATKVLPIAEAKQLGAMALFGEKYPDFVRVVTMGDFSTELCGGTHLGNTGQVGLCRVVKDELIAAGVRRITCLTGQKALARIRETEDLLKELGTLLKTPTFEDIPRKLQQTLDELRDVKKELAKYTQASLADSAAKLVSEAPTVGTSKVVVVMADSYARDDLRELVDQLRSQAPSVALLLGHVAEGKCTLIASLTKDLVTRGLNASECVKLAAKVVGGGGGGRPDLAEAGGKNPAQMPAALEAGRAYFTSKLA